MHRLKLINMQMYSKVCVCVCVLCVNNICSIRCSNHNVHQFSSAIRAIRFKVEYYACELVQIVCVCDEPSLIVCY